MLSYDGVKLTFTKEALQFIAKKAIEDNTGARGLRAIIEEKMTDLMFTVPDEDDVVGVTVTVSRGELVFRKRKARRTKVA